MRSAQNSGFHLVYLCGSQTCLTTERLLLSVFCSVFSSLFFLSPAEPGLCPPLPVPPPRPALDQQRS